MPALEEEAAPVVVVVPSDENVVTKEPEKVELDATNEITKTLIPVESAEEELESNDDTVEATNQEEKEENVAEVMQSENKTEAKTESDAETKSEGVVLRKRTPGKKEDRDEDVSPPKRMK